jgi:hypothetical protein
VDNLLDYLAVQAHGEVCVDAALDRALERLDAVLAEIAAALAVEHYGPGVGVEGRADVYRLVVRAHQLDARSPPAWGLKICDATPHGNWRVAWAIHAASRRRKHTLVKALPEFFDGYAEAVAAAGKTDTPAGRRLLEIAKRFAGGRAAPAS